jgi:hypothetical protein
MDSSSARGIFLPGSLISPPRKAECLRAIKVCQPGEHDPDNGSQHARQKQLRHPADGCDLSVQEEYGKQADCHRKKRAGRNEPSDLQVAQHRQVQIQFVAVERDFEPRPEVCGVAGQSNAAGRDGEGSAEGKLPDEKERNHAAQLARPVDFVQIAVRAARTGHGSSQFGPHQSVTNREQRAQNPAKHRLRTTAGTDDERDGNERTDADHIDHV